MAEAKQDAIKLLSEDHREVEQLFEKFEKAKGDAKKEEIEHHVKEEEKQQGNIFSQARKADVDLEALGEQMAARKAELMQLAESEGLPPAPMATMEQL